MAASPPLNQWHVPGGWTETTVRLPGKAFQLVVPADPDRVLEAAAREELAGGSPADPYWATLWSAAVPTAAAVLRRRWPGGQRALELGCGLGLVGLAGLAAGLNVTFSDRHPAALAAARENARRNGFPNASVLQLDWRRPIDSSFPVILAADVLYNAALHQPLAALLERMLAPDGLCWIGDPGRYAARRFLQLAAERGFQIRLTDAEGSPLGAPPAGRYQLIELRRLPG